MSGERESLRSSARRRFLARAGSVTGAALMPGLAVVPLAHARRTREPHESVSGDVRYGMLVDAGRCARDCDACVRACDDEHGLDPKHGPATDPRWIHKVTLRDRRTGRVSALPLMCQHCADPPCVDVCPTGASFKRADGIVLVDKHNLHRLPLLRHGVPVPGARVRARRGRELEALVFAWQGHGGIVHPLCTSHRRGRRARPFLCRSVRRGRASCPRLRRSERPGESGLEGARARSQRGAPLRLRP